jgi:DNA-binding transcriptional regulator YiaG
MGDYGGVKMDKVYKDEISMICHEQATALFEIGAIDEARMREYDADCLIQPSSAPLSSIRIKQPEYARA